MSRAADRRNFLGGSDAAAVLGVSNWMTPVQLWMLKTGKAKPEVTPQQERARRRGHKLEPFIRSMVIDKLADEGHDVELVACNQRYTDPTYPFLSCEIDFELRIDGEHTPSDAKSVDRFVRDQWGEAGTDAMPITYAAQFMHGLGIVPGRPRRTLVAALRGFDDVDIYWLNRDDETIAAMREKEVSFWLDHVVPKVPPDPAKFSDVRALFPKATKPNIQATPEILAKVERMREIEKLQAELSVEHEALKFDIGRFMGKHSLLTNGVRDLISWDNEPRRSFDERAFKRDHPDWVALYMKTESIRVMRKASRRA